MKLCVDFQVSDSSLEEKVGSLRHTVSRLEAELEEARNELNVGLETVASRRGEVMGYQSEVNTITLCAHSDAN